MRPCYVIFVALVIAGCGRDAPGEAGPVDAAPAQPSVFDPLTETVDRAGGVETTLQDAAAERRRQLESQE